MILATFYTQCHMTCYQAVLTLNLVACIMTIQKMCPSVISILTNSVGMYFLMDSSKDICLLFISHLP